MPTAHCEGPYRFRFYSIDCNEPAHVHVVRDRRSQAKVWLVSGGSVEVAYSHFSGTETRRVVSIIEQNHQKIMEAWYAHCGEN